MRIPLCHQHSRPPAHYRAPAAPPPVQRAAWRDLPPLRPTLTSDAAGRPPRLVHRVAGDLAQPQLPGPARSRRRPGRSERSRRGPGQSGCPTGHLRRTRPAGRAAAGSSSSPASPAIRRAAGAHAADVALRLGRRIRRQLPAPAHPVGADLLVPDRTAARSRRGSPAAAGTASSPDDRPPSFTSAPDQDVARALPVVMRHHRPAPSSAPDVDVAAPSTSAPTVSRHIADDHQRDHAAEHAVEAPTPTPRIVAADRAAARRHRAANR